MEVGSGSGDILWADGVLQVTVLEGNMAEGGGRSRAGNSRAESLLSSVCQRAFRVFRSLHFFHILLCC